MVETSQERHRNSLSLVLVSTAHAANHIYQLATPIILLKLGFEYNLSIVDAGLILLAFNLPYALLPILFGALSKRVGRRRLLSAGFLAISVAFAILSLSTSMSSVMMALFVAGVGGSTYHVLGIPLVAELFPVKRGEALGYHQTGGSLGSFVAPLIVGALAETTGWRSASIILSILGVILSAILWFSLQDSAIVDNNHSSLNLRELRTPLTIILATACLVTAFRGLQLFGIYYFDLGKGLGTQAYLLMSLSNIAGIFSGPIAGRLSDMMDRRKTIVALAVVEGISAFGLVLLPGGLLYATVLVFGFAFYGLLATTDAFLSDVSTPESFSTIIGINSTASFTVTSILSYLLGNSINALGYDPSYTILAVFPFLSLPIVLSIRKSNKK